MKNPYNLSVSQCCFNAQRAVVRCERNYAAYKEDGIFVRGFPTPAACMFAVKRRRVQRALLTLGYPVANDVLPYFKDRRSLVENVEQNIKVFTVAKEIDEQQKELF